MVKKYELFRLLSRALYFAAVFSFLLAVYDCFSDYFQARPYCNTAGSLFFSQLDLLSYFSLLAAVFFIYFLTAALSGRKQMLNDKAVVFYFLLMSICFTIHVTLFVLTAALLLSVGISWLGRDGGSTNA